MIKPARILSLGISFLILTCGMSAMSQTLKVGIVDIDKVMTEYYRAKEVLQTVNQAKDAANKEIEARIAALKKDEDALQRLRKEAESQAVSEETRQKKIKLFQEKANAFSVSNRELGEIRAKKGQQIGEQMERMRKSIVEEIIVVVQDQAKAGAYDLVLDKSGLSSNRMSMVLFSKPELDFSAAVIQKLNEKKPVEAPAAGDAGKKNK